MNEESVVAPVVLEVDAFREAGQVRDFKVGRRGRDLGLVSS